jgi:exopolysaccharide/PEP-CTERM locus tyrosine autokinase
MTREGILDDERGSAGIIDGNTGEHLLGCLILETEPLPHSQESEWKDMGRIYEALEAARKARRKEEAPMPPPPPPPRPIKNKKTKDDQKSDQPLPVLTSPDSVIAEHFRFLRSRITRPTAGAPPRTVMVTSALGGEGKTFVACNLAAAISQSLEEYVLLIDADIRKPSVHKVFGIQDYKEGLSTHLANGAPLSSVLRKTMIDKLTILPSGNSTKIPAELLSSEKMETLIQEVRDRYPDRFVIIDSPPLEYAAESSVIANSVDAVIVVVRYGKSPRQTVKSALRRIPKEKLLGIVFNAYEQSLARFGAYRYMKYGYGK